MKRIKEIDQLIEQLVPKMEINAQDWTKEEKEAIAKSYFEISKVTTGRGRALDVHCSSCVVSAVGIIRNYMALVVEEQMQEPTHFSGTGVELKKVIEPSNPNWRKNLDSINEAAKELEINVPEFQELKTKKEKIAAIEAHLIFVNA